MSITGAAYTNSSYQAGMTNPYIQAKQDFLNLGKALQSGNLADAQQAFATLQQDATTTAQSQGSQNSNSSSQAMKDLGDALQSGDLTAAQKAFAQLQKTGKGHGHHHKHDSSQQDSQQSGISGTDTNLTAAIQEMTYSGQGTIGTPTRANSGDATPANSTVNVLL